MTSTARLLIWVLAAPLGAGALGAQAFNIDFGEPENAPLATYGAAGQPGVWNAFRADNGMTTTGLVDVAGRVTSVSLLQIGGTDTPTVEDPATTGDDSLLMDDYLVTFTSSLESCIFLDGVAPGRYEVLIYAWMPNQPAVLSYTNVDQELGNPHYEVGGEWPGGQREATTFSRHWADVGVDGNLDLHSGISPGGNELLGAALNALQIRPVLFGDGFETGDTGRWSTVVQ
ncbi:MAG: hypothetical protein R2991_08135 [Thermoanaerobaculia bacterium]